MTITDQIRSGSILSATVKIGFPILIGNFVFFFQIMVDTYFISMIDFESTALLAGIGLVAPIFFLFLALATALGVGISSLVGRTLVNANVHHLKMIPNCGLLVCLLITVPFFLVASFSLTPIMDILAGKELSEEAIVYGSEYFFSLLPAIFFMLLSRVYGGILLGEGETTVIAVASLLLMFLNVILTPVFIFGFDLGVSGAGIATSLAVIVSFMVLWVYYVKYSIFDYKIDFNLIEVETIKEISRIGCPQFLIALSGIWLMMVVNNYVGNISEDAMNAWIIVARFNFFIAIPLGAIADTTLPMIAQNYGGYQFERIKKIYLIHLICGALFTAATATIYIFSSGCWLQWFTANEVVIEIAEKTLTCIALLAIVMVFRLISSAALIGLATPKPFLFLSIFQTILSIMIAKILIEYWGWGINGILIAIVIGELVILPLGIFSLSKTIATLQLAKNSKQC